MHGSQHLFQQFNNERNGLVLQEQECPPEARGLLVSGHLDTSNAASFSRVVQAWLDECGAVRELWFDLTGLRYISSSGIGAFVQLLMAAQGCGVALRLLGLGPNVQAVFDALGFSRFFVLER